MNRLSEHDMELMIAQMLKVGVSLAAVLVVVGGVLLLRDAHAGLPDYTHFHAEDASLCSLSAITVGALHFKARSVIQFGLLVLIATPVARVAFCVGGFLRQRNGLYVAVSTIVLVVLIYSLTKGAH
jgi:uncharacterized membrane protein